MTDQGGRPPTDNERRQAAADASEAFRGAEAPKKGGKLKKIIIAVIILLVLAAGGAAAYYFFFYEPEKPKEKPEKDDEPPRAAQGPPNYARVPNLMVPVLGPEGPQAIVQINVRVQVASEGYVESVQNNGHMVQDLLNQAVYGYVNDSYSQGQTKLDLKRLESEMLAALQERLGESAVLDVAVLGLEQRSSDPEEGAG